MSLKLNKYLLREFNKSTFIKPSYIRKKSPINMILIGDCYELCNYIFIESLKRLLTRTSLNPYQQVLFMTNQIDMYTCVCVSNEDSINKTHNSNSILDSYGVSLEEPSKELLRALEFVSHYNGIVDVGNGDWFGTQWITNEDINTDTILQLSRSHSMNVRVPSNKWNMYPQHPLYESYKKNVMSLFNELIEYQLRPSKYILTLCYEYCLDRVINTSNKFNEDSIEDFNEYTYVYVCNKSSIESLNKTLTIYDYKDKNMIHTTLLMIILDDSYKNLITISYKTLNEYSFKKIHIEPLTNISKKDLLESVKDFYGSVVNNSNEYVMYYDLLEDYGVLIQ